MSAISNIMLVHLPCVHKMSTTANTLLVHLTLLQYTCTSSISTLVSIQLQHVHRSHHSPSPLSCRLSIPYSHNLHNLHCHVGSSILRSDNLLVYYQSQLPCQFTSSTLVHSPFCLQSTGSFLFRSPSLPNRPQCPFYSRLISQFLQISSVSTHYGFIYLMFAQSLQVPPTPPLPLKLLSSQTQHVIETLVLQDKLKNMPPTGRQAYGNGDLKVNQNTVRPEAINKWAAVFMRKHETWYSSILKVGDRLAQVFVVFFTPSKQMSEVHMKLSHRRFLSRHFQLIIHKSSYPLTLHGLSY